MKRIYVVLMILMLSGSVYAQAFRAYIQVTYYPMPRTVSICIGDKVIVPKDSNGQPLQFNTTVAVLNWLSKRGWHVEPVSLNNGNQTGNTFLMSRDNTTEEELRNTF